MVQPIAATRQHHAAPATFWPQVLPSLAADVVHDGHFQNKMDDSMDWFKGKSTGNHGFYH